MRLLCVLGLAFAVTSAFGQKTNISGFVDSLGGEHIFYLDTNSHLNQLYYVGGTAWQTQDLTAIYGGNTPNADSPLTSFPDSSGGEHVFYVDSSKNLNQLYYPGTGTVWYPQNLTGTYAPSGGGVVATSALASFLDSSDGSEHVFFIDPINGVDQFFYPGSGASWYWQQVSSSYGGNNAASTSPLAAYEDALGGEHVVYLDSSNNVNQMYYPGSGTTWFAQNLTAIYGGNTPASTSNLTVFLDSSNGQHIVYQDSSQNLNQLFYISGTTWSTQNLTALYGGNTPETASHLASYVDATGDQHIVYLDSNQHVNQLFYSGGAAWFPQDLTALYGGNTAGSSSVLIAFPLSGDTFMIGQHIAYLDGSDNVNQIYYPATGGSTWYPQNLSVLYNGNAPALLPVSN